MYSTVCPRLHFNKYLYSGSELKGENAGFLAHLSQKLLQREMSSLCRRRFVRKMYVQQYDPDVPLLLKGKS